MSDTLDLSALADDLLDEKTVDLSDGRKLRLSEEPDYFTSIDDYDCYGKLAHIPRHRREHPVRPDGFDGFARKVWTHDGECFWWQPPDDLRTAKRESVYIEAADGTIHRHPEAYRDPVGQMERTVRDLLAYGFLVLRVQVLEACSCCRQERMIGSSVLGGIEAMADRQYMLDMVADLVTEALEDAKS